MMTNAIPARLLVVAMAVIAAHAQKPRVVVIQKDLFSAGGAFVNAWADYDVPGGILATSQLRIAPATRVFEHRVAPAKVP